MKFSESWVREWVDPEISSAELAEQLTMLGLEVDDYAPAGGDFSDVVVGKIESVEQHPDADRLRVCQVNDGNGSCLLYTSPSPRDKRQSRMPSSA